MPYPLPPGLVTDSLFEGIVIPAHPLALTAQRKLDERRQRALTRYYHAAGAGGIAVAVHTTQFEIREAGIDLYEPVVRMAEDEVRVLDRETGRQTVLIGGIVGETQQAVREAEILVRHGYHAGLLSLAALKSASVEQLVNHCKRVAEVIPIVGFYLQPAVGGRLLPADFWELFFQIPNVIAVKTAPFNRYQTIDVLHGLARSGRASEVALYTGNDDNILVDLLTPFHIRTENGDVTLHFHGGLLGHWACWTRRAVEQLERCKEARRSGTLPTELLTLAAEITDANGVLFDVANQFAGCIPGIHEVLRRQGLLKNLVCLNPHETLSPGQSEEIDRIYRDYPHLNDDTFVAEHLEKWLG